jgi:phosphohistidine phosphatase SixA
MQLRILLTLLVCCLTGNTTATANDGEFTLYLVRHAEKQADGSRDPALTEAGNHRAEQLANWLLDKGIMDIWSSDYKRTRDTAEPLLAKLGLTLNSYKPRDLAMLADELLRNQYTALVVGHSNTTPELASLICHCSIAAMDESDYDQLIEISVDGENIQVKTLQQSLLIQP